METTEGTLLGGARAPRAAADRPPHRAGTGAAGRRGARPAGRARAGRGHRQRRRPVCLAARVAGIRGVGVERDPGMAALARANAAATGSTGWRCWRAIAGWRRRAFDHALANPPWHAPAPPRPAGARGGEAGAPGLVGCWAARLAAPLRHRGTLSLVARPPRCGPAWRRWTAAGCGSPAVLPLWPQAGRPAGWCWCRGSKGGAAPVACCRGWCCMNRTADSRRRRMRCCAAARRWR